MTMLICVHFLHASSGVEVYQTSWQFAHGAHEQVIQTATSV